MSLYVGDRVVCRCGFHPNLHTMQYNCWGQEDGGEELRIEMNRGVLWGRSRPGRGCSTIDGWMDIRKMNCASSWSFTRNKVYFAYLPVAKVLLDTANLAITYWKKHHNYLGTGEGIVLNVQQPDGFDTLIKMSSLDRKLLRRERLIPKMLANEEVSIVLTRQINFDRDKKKDAMDGLATSGWKLQLLCAENLQPRNN